MKIHFIGIGGIGVSSLAFYFLNRGDSITGSDLKESDITRSLEKFGAKIIIGNHSPKNITKEVDLVIHTPAIKEDNPEIKKAKKKQYQDRELSRGLGKIDQRLFHDCRFRNSWKKHDHCDAVTNLDRGRT